MTTTCQWTMPNKKNKGNKMKKTQLGKSELTISPITFGAWAIGGTWGKVNDSEAIRWIETLYG